MNRMADFGIFTFATDYSLGPDVIAREVVMPGTPGLAAMVDLLGAAILAADGTLDRSTVRARVFESPSLRRRIEALLHPLIRARTETQLAALDAAYAIAAIPLRCFSKRPTSSAAMCCASAALPPLPAISILLSLAKVSRHRVAAASMDATQSSDRKSVV